MEEPLTLSAEDSLENAQNHGKQETLSAKDLVEKSQESELTKALSSESVKKVPKGVKPNGSMMPKGNASTGIVKKKAEVKSGLSCNLTGTRSTLTKSTVSSASRSSGSIPVIRRNSTGGLHEKQPTSLTKGQDSSVSTVAGKRSGSSALDPVRRSLPEIRRSSLPPASTKTATRSGISEVRNSVPVSPVARATRTSSSSDASKQDFSKRSSTRPSPTSVSSIKRVPSTSLDSTGSSSSLRKSVAKVSSPSSRSPSVSSGSKTGSLSTSMDRSSNLSGRKKVGTPESRDSRFIMLPQVEIKAGDDVVIVAAYD